MSTFERYDQASLHYDDSRAAKGLEIVLACLGAEGRRLGDLHLLDAGCGTGNYSRALIGHLGRVTGLDLSEGMLKVARGKLGREIEAGRVALHQGSITAMPFAAEEFDAVIFNQVLHHLESGDDPHYGGHAAAIAEAGRVLRPGGTLLINACSHEQLANGFWAYHLAPQGLDAVQARCVPMGRLAEILADCGFDLRERFVPLEAILQGPSYLDPMGPSKESWRKGDSFWALLDEVSLARSCAKLAALEASGELAAFQQKGEEGRRRFGQFTYLWASKS